MEDDLWVYEDQTPYTRIMLKCRSKLVDVKTPFQRLEIWDSYEFGRVMLLDGAIQVTERDEFVYHEMIAHVPLFTHPDPERVLIIGGGDGGSAREAARHPGVKEVVVVDIDPMVPEYSKKYFPSLGGAYDNPKVHLRIEDGIKYVKESGEKYDVIIVDSTDPVGPGVVLYTEDFYRALKNSLRDGGILVSQSGSPFLWKDQLKTIYRLDSKLFRNVVPYWAVVPTYPSGFWAFTMASDSPLDAPEDLEERVKSIGKTRYYSHEIHRASMVLPPFMKDILQSAIE